VDRTKISHSESDLQAEPQAGGRAGEELLCSEGHVEAVCPSKAAFTASAHLLGLCDKPQ